MKRPTRYGISDPEENDGVPVEMPMGACRPTPLNELIARMVQTAIQAEKGDEFETMDEANDFEEEDDSSLLDMSSYTLPEVNEEEPLKDQEEPPPPNDEEAFITMRQFRELVAEKTGDAPNPDEPESGKP